MKTLQILGCACLLTWNAASVCAQESYKIWYDKPAAYWEEALPVGNGRIAAMVFGNPQMERLQLNEETVSAGSPYQNYNPE